MSKLSVLLTVLWLGLATLLFAFQDAPSAYDTELFTRVARLETQVGQIVPTQEVFATDTPTPTMTPTPQWCFARGTVNTPNASLRVREAPNGTVTRTLANGAAVVFSTDTRKVGQYTWVELTTGGWIALEFITQAGQISCE